MRKIYFISGGFWYQEELKFVENEKVREILRGKISLENVNAEKLGEIVDKLYKDGILKELIPIVLKKYKGINFYSLWNKLFCHKLTSNNIIEKMTDTQIARVMVDFFIFKTNWLMSLFDSQSKSTWNLMKAIPNLITGKKLSTSLQREI